MIEFLDNLDRHSNNKTFCFCLPNDTRDRLEKLRPEEITLSEMVRQVLDHYVGLKRPQRAYHVEASKGEKLLIKKMKAKKTKDRK